jgi:hypothetical protein
MTVPGCPAIEYTITLLPGSGVLTSCTITDPGSSDSGTDPSEKAKSSPAANAPPSDRRGWPQNGRQSGSHHASCTGTGRGASRRILA